MVVICIVYFFIFYLFYIFLSYLIFLLLSLQLVNFASGGRYQREKAANKNVIFLFFDIPTLLIHNIQVCDFYKASR